MIIDLNGHKYDTDLSFEEQSQDVIDYCNECICSVAPIFNYDDYNRPCEIVYEIDGNEVVIEQVFKSQSVSCDLDSVIKSARGKQIWHDKTKSIQVVLSIETQIAILTAYPEFSIFTVEGGMPTFVEGNNIYLYDNALSIEYRQLIQYFGGIINDKNI